MTEAQRQTLHALLVQCGLAEGQWATGAALVAGGKWAVANREAILAAFPISSVVQLKEEKPSPARSLRAAASLVRQMLRKVEGPMLLYRKVAVRHDGGRKGRTWEYRYRVPPSPVQ